MYSILLLFNRLVDVFIFVIFAQVIASWLIAFNIINVYQPLVSRIIRVLDAITAPLLRPIQRILPSPGGLDFSPILLLLMVYFLRDLINEFALR